MCFIVACYNYPRFMRSVRGRTESELDDEAWAYLFGPGEGNVNDMSLGLYIRLARASHFGNLQDFG